MVKAKLDSYFVIKRNIIFERSKFNKRVQLENEAVDLFVTDLHCMAEHCQFVETTVRVDFEKPVNQARQSEAVKKQQVLFRDDQHSYGAKDTVDDVHESKFYTKKEQQRKDRGHTATPNATYQRCRKSSSHARSSCSAKDAVCRKCSK